MPTKPTYPLERYAATMAQAVERPETAQQVLGWLALCVRAGGWLEFPGGFIAWFRCGWEHFEACYWQDLEALWALPTAELTHGPVVMVANCLALKKGELHTALQHIRQLPGVEILVAWAERGTRWTMQRVEEYHATRR